MNLTDIRQHLHQYPELSHQEYETSRFIESIMVPLNPDQIIHIGEFSKVYVFDSGKPGSSIIFRADMDALPIQERNELSYQSENKGVAHLCGHDGHSTILIGFARRIAENRPSHGKVALLFQAAEETGMGAKEVMESKEFLALNADYIFGLHNIPGYALHQVLLKPGSFAAASKGMKLKLKGKTCHAAEPEKGINPALAMADITHQLHKLIQQKQLFQNLSLITFIYSRLGEIAFGTSPGFAEMGFTLRAFENKDMALLIEKAEHIIQNICKNHALDFEIEYLEEFPATVNDEEAINIIEQAAIHKNLSISHIPESMRWSEDFGYYNQKIRGGFFGLGSGENHAELHHHNFDFPDDLIETGVSLFEEIYRSVLDNTNS
ncbi:MULTISPECIES: amidohydrolase [unclassified Lentimicrobium]|uniref:amidohydrolase n=1 Tax=unclassified Lentimicrobium TaxID=2677434 RepID=UPI0015558AE0|nr:MULTISPECIES: amidohydrolase [unclassified Lentimicrobium]NPD47667.1 amidohydrolase [Lentimicrobium sp. S6]NPD86621.1 amidohydrolase [Lentimicrobium sp. L6]